MRWLFRGAVTLATMILLVLLVLVLVPAERVARLAADRVSAATGRAVTVEGPVRATLWPRFGVRAQDVTLASAPWSEEGPMLRAASMEVSLGLGFVLGGDIRIEALEIDGARLLLERRADGVGSWDLDGAPDLPAEVREGPADAPTASPADRDAARALSIDRVVFRNSEVTWIDRAAGREIRLRAVDLETRLDGPDAPIELTASALVGDVAAKLAARASALGALLDGAPTPVTLALSGAGTALAFDGLAGLDPLAVEGRMEARSDDGFALLAALGIAKPGPPAWRDRVAVMAALTVGPTGAVQLRDMVADLGGNRLTGSLDVDPAAPRPRLRADLAADALDLTTTAAAPAAPDGAGEDRSPPAPAPRTGWSTDPIDVSALHAMDGEVTLATGPVTLDGGRIDELRARVTIEEGRAVIALQPMLAYGATITGEVVINGRGGLSSRADLEVAGLQLQPFLTDLAGFDRLVGKVDLSVDLLGVGGSEQALMDSLEGTAAIRVDQGEMLGLDLEGMIRTLDLAYRGEGRETIFDSLSLSATLSEGIARSDDLALAAPPYLSAAGEGGADIGARTISYRLLPTLRAERDGEDLTVPILIEGPWADPAIRPDLEYVARQRLDLERERIETRALDEARAAGNRAGDALRQRLARELEVAPEALDTREGLENAIRDRLQDQVLDLLRGR